jgi:hypothetical protein
MSLEAAPEATPGGRAWRHALLAMEAVVGYVAVRMLVVGGAGAFPGAGNVYVGPGHPHELKIVDGVGYDGQFVYRLAIEPFTTHLTGHGITFDVPAYRQQRIMTALLARIVSEIPGVSTAVALIVVNAAAVVVAVVAGMRLAADLGRRPALGILVAVPAGVVAGFVADLTEPVAWAAVLVGIVFARRHRWLAASAAFAIAMLARETAAIVVLGFLIESLIVLRRERTRETIRRMWLLVAGGVETAWQLWLWHIWGTLPVLAGLRSVGVRASFTSSPDALVHRSTSRLPGLGIVQTFLEGLATGDTSSTTLGISYLVERVILLALIVTAAWALVSQRARPGIALTVSWALSAAVALSMTSWQDDIQFLRAAMEAWGLSIFVLMTVRTRWAASALVGGAVVTGWVVIYFLPRV